MITIKCKECLDSDAFVNEADAKESGWKKHGTKWTCQDCSDETDEDDDFATNYSLFSGGWGGFGGGSIGGFGGGSFGGGGGSF